MPLPGGLLGLRLIVRFAQPLPIPPECAARVWTIGSGNDVPTTSVDGSRQTQVGELPLFQNPKLLRCWCSAAANASVVNPFSIPNWTHCRTCSGVSKSMEPWVPCSSSSSNVVARPNESLRWVQSSYTAIEPILRDFTRSWQGNQMIEGLSFGIRTRSAIPRWARANFFQ